MIDWGDIDTVLLDMDGTLLDLRFDNYFWGEYLPRIYARHHSISESRSSLHLMKSFSSERGTLQWYCLDHWSERLNMDIPALKHKVRHLVRIRPYVMAFLRSLHSAPQKVLLVTNAHRKTLDIKLEQVDIAPWFDDIIVSHDLQAPKEQEAFWERLHRLHPFDPERTLLIDDTETVLESAHRFGIAHLLTLLQPDSGEQKRIQTRFPGIHHFDEIMPGTS
ncbi:MAG: GMP/IMP nucleotidase [Pseudomonadota bacterium]